MGKWIAAAVIFVCLVLPVPVLIAMPRTTVSDITNAWLAPREETALARGALEDVRQRKFQPVIAAFDPNVLSAKSPERLNALANLFPKEAPQSLKLINSAWDLSSAPRIHVKLYRFIYEYQFAHSWMLAEVFLYRENGRLLIYRLNAQPTAQSIAQVNALTFRSPGHVLFATFAALVFLFWLVSVYACLFTPIVEHKWLWVLFVLVGVMGLNLNWTTGQLGFLPINLAIPAAWLWTNLYGPWIVQISLPLGAIIFWFRRSNLVPHNEPGLRRMPIVVAE